MPGWSARCQPGPRASWPHWSPTCRPRPRRRTSSWSGNAAADGRGPGAGRCRRSRAPHRARRHAQAREGRRAAAVSLSWPGARFWHDCIYGTWQMIFVIDQSVSCAPRQGSLSCCRKVVCSRRLQRTEPGHLRWACHAGRADCQARLFGDLAAGLPGALFKTPSD
jgi:hypothetical protein